MAGSNHYGTTPTPKAQSLTSSTAYPESMALIPMQCNTLLKTETTTMFHPGKMLPLTPLRMQQVMSGTLAGSTHLPKMYQNVLQKEIGL